MCALLWLDVVTYFFVGSLVPRQCGMAILPWPCCVLSGTNIWLRHCSQHRLWKTGRNSGIRFRPVLQQSVSSTICFACIALCYSYGSHCTFHIWWFSFGCCVSLLFVCSSLLPFPVVKIVNPVRLQKTKCCATRNVTVTNKSYVLPYSLTANKTDFGRYIDDMKPHDREKHAKEAFPGKSPVFFFLTPCRLHVSRLCSEWPAKSSELWIRSFFVHCEIDRSSKGQTIQHQSVYSVYQYDLRSFLFCTIHFYFYPS